MYSPRNLTLRTIEHPQHHGHDSCSARCRKTPQPDQRRRPTLKISVITAVFNRVDTVADALASVRDQNYGAVEHIVQDGGSTDGTLDILSGFGAATISAPDEGIYDAINKGISRATGDIVGLLHSDDFFASETVLSDVARALEDANVDGVYGDLQYVSAQDQSRVIRHWSSGSYAPERLKYGWMPPHPTLYLRREVFERWGHYDTSFRIAADYDAMLRWMTTGQVHLAYIPQVLIKMRIGGASNRSLAQIMQKSREDLRAIRGNNVGGIPTLACKNLRKIGQFIYRETTTS